MDRETTWPCVLTVAGSDSGAGAGIQADLKTCAALRTYGVSAITAVTAQNTLGVVAVEPMPPAMVAQQMAVVLEDFPVAAIKLGMLCNEQIVKQIALQLQRLALPVVLDPVVLSSSGTRLLSEAALKCMVEELIPKTTVLTPNIAEAALLSGCSVDAVMRDPDECGKALLRLGCQAVLLKGGHLPGEQCVDRLFVGERVRLYSHARVETRNNHGTGCTLSAAIAAELAKGCEAERAVGAAKEYVHSALLAADRLGYGKGAGPLQHFFR